MYTLVANLVPRAPRWSRGVEKKFLSQVGRVD